MSEDRQQYGSEIARIVAADLSADYGPDQRSAAGDLARLMGLEGRVRAVVDELRAEVISVEQVVEECEAAGYAIYGESEEEYQGRLDTLQHMIRRLETALRGEDGSGTPE